MRAKIPILAAIVTCIFAAQAVTGRQLLDYFDLTGFNAQFQARIEQRVIIRFPNQPVTPATGRGDNRKAIIYNEEKIGKCLLMDRLIASRPGPKNSLELVTRERQLIRAYLGDGCLAREFYAGAYVERSTDGKLCIDRDLLHARTGAKCEIDRFRLLVPE